MPDDFFVEKRPWSRVKDGILEYYFEVYLKKVNRLGKDILIFDTFAGPGQFKIGNEPGSPLIIIETAERWVPGRYTAVFTNIERTEHEELAKRLNSFPNAHPYNWRAGKMLRKIYERVKDQVLFLYLDPFGLEDCDFSLIKPLLDRTKQGHSTELLLVFQMPILHREAACNRVRELLESLPEGQRKITQAISMLDAQTQAKIQNVNKLMGGSYWQEIEYGDLPTSDREDAILSAYIGRLAGGDKYGVWCPVEASFGGNDTKYYVCFISRSDDALWIMNEAMYTSRDAHYGKESLEQARADFPLFNDPLLSLWEIEKRRASEELTRLIPHYVEMWPGSERDDLWLDIVKDRFMEFSRSEYYKRVKALAKSKRIIPVRDGEVANRINASTKLFLPNEVPF